MTRYDPDDTPERDEERDRFDLDDRSPATGLYEPDEPDRASCPARGGVCRLPECRDGCGWADGC